VAAATAAAAPASTAGGAARRRGRAAVAGGSKHGELDGGFLAGALRTGDFLLFVDDDFFELRLAVVANIFVNGHFLLRWIPFDYSRRAALEGGDSNRRSPSKLRVNTLRYHK
jgi:hypothetical protein